MLDNGLRGSQLHLDQEQNGERAPGLNETQANEEEQSI